MLSMHPSIEMLILHSFPESDSPFNGDARYHCTGSGNQKQRQNQQLSDKQNDLVAEEKELDAANKYFDKLKPSCIDSGVPASSYIFNP